MAESILEQNVVVEIAESVGTEDVSTRIQTGTERVKTFLGCEAVSYTHLTLPTICSV